VFPKIIVVLSAVEPSLVKTVCVKLSRLLYNQKTIAKFDEALCVMSFFYQVYRQTVPSRVRRHLMVDKTMPNQNTELYDAFEQNGRQSSAYFIFQEHVQCFESENKIGQVFFASQMTPLGRVQIVFTNPICSEENMTALLKEFLAEQRVPTLFVAVDQEVAEALRPLGYYINQTGTESRIPLKSFELHGHKKKQLRHAANYGRRKNCEVKELQWCDVDEVQVKSLSNAWRKSKGVSTREMQFVTRPPVFGDEWGVRKFYCMQGDKLLAYVFFDPYFKQGKLVGYCANILRSLPERDCNGAIDYTILEAVKIFKEEGVSELSLGVAPLNNIQKDVNDRRGARWFSQLFYNYGNGLYACKALAYHKSRYRPIETPWYLCTKDVSLFRAYWGLLFGLKVLGSKEL